MQLVHACSEYPGLLEDILDSLQQAVILTDPDGIVTYASRATESVMGFRPDDLVGNELATLFTPEDLTYLYPNLLFLARHNQPFEGEAMLRRKNDTRFFAFIVLKPFHQNGGGHALTAFCVQDIDRQKQFELAIRDHHFEDLVKVANGIAHELRNPLVGIGGFATRLYKSCQTSVDHETYYGHIVDNVRRIENLVKKVDTLVSLPKPYFRMESSNTLIDLAVSPYLTDIEAKQVVLDRRMEEVDLLVDRELVVQAVTILLENAVEAVAARGRILIHGDANDETCEICVSDTGPGIQPEDQPFVFNPFFTSKPTGAGIDLAVVKRIMESHGGRVGVMSTPGDGSTFFLRFPFERRRSIRTKILE